MNLKQFRYFCETVETKSGKAAAEKLFVAPTAISMQISLLEESLGGELFNRGSRPMELTPLGHFFYPKIKQLLNDLDKLVNETKEIAKENRGWLSVGFIRSTIFSILPNSIREFKEKNPDIKIDLIELLSDHQITSIRKGLIHVGLIRHIGNFEKEDDINYVFLLHDPIVAVVPKAHYLADNSTLPLMLLKELPFISYPNDPASTFASNVIRLLQEQDAAPNVKYYAKEIHTALGLVGSGLGITVAGKSVIDNNRNDVKFLAIDSLDIFSDIYLITKKHDGNKHVENFKEIIISQLNAKNNF